MERPAHGGNLDWAARIAGCPASSLLDFSASINPLGPPPQAMAAVRDHLQALRHYPDPDCTRLRQALSQWHQLPEDWILPGNGSAELLTWAARELAQQDVTYLPTPAFGDYWRALKAFSARVRTCPFPESWDPKVQPGPSAGLLLNNPHNPTGQLFPRTELLPYLEAFSLVVVDEAFMEFLPPSQDQSLISAVRDSPNLVILRSLTKFYSLPGLRLGYAIAHPDRLRRWQQWRDPWPVNCLAAVAAEAAIQDRAFQQQTWDWLLPARESLFEGLAALPGLHPFPGAANFLLVRTQVPGSQLQGRLLKDHRLLIRDCLSFPELGEGYFRTAVRTAEENHCLLAALAGELEKSF